MASVTSLTLTDSGQRYTSVPNVIIAVPDADSTTATATANLDSTGDGVNYVAVAEVGNYYTTVPTVTFSSPTTDSANATAIISATDSDRITGISIVDSGIYYTTVPNVTIGVPSLDSATATATGNMTLDGDKLSTATLTSAGRYYTRRPTVRVERPIDSDLYDKTTFIYKKFGYSSLHHDDSTDTTVLTEFVSSDIFDSFYAEPANTIVETSFWLYLDSVKASTILYNNDFRLHMDSSGYIGATYNVFGTIIGDSAETFSITKYNTQTPISTGSWTFIQFQTLHEDSSNLSTKLRISVNGSYDSTYNISAGLETDSNYNFNYYDSGETITFGADVDSNGPRPIKRDLTKANIEDVTRSFNGYLDNFAFTVVSGESAFDSDQSIRIPDSANDYYYSTTPAIQQKFDYGQAFILASFDSGVVTSLLVTESGTGYTSTPTITIDPPTGSKAAFRATASASVNSATGKVSGVTVTFPGRFYDSDVNPSVIIDSATGTAADFRAQGTAVVTNGSVTSITLTDSGQYYLSDPEVIIEGPTGTAANFRATGRVFLDSDNRKIRRISLIDGGRFYETVPAVTIEGGDSTDDFLIGETASQTLSSGVVISGEVAKWSDSDNKLYLIHAGANDGEYHTFVTGLPIVSTSGANGNVLSVSEDNKISENEQNEEFSPSVSNELDFLDFTENNPFGDPENN